MNESILNYVKVQLGIPPECCDFDAAIIGQINAVLAVLNQIGLGPETGLIIHDMSTTWSELIGTNNLLAFVPTYVYMKVRLQFDPPTSSIAMDSLKNSIAEYESRINYLVD